MPGKVGKNVTNHDKMALALSSIAIAVTVGFSLSAVEAAQTSAQNRIGQAQAEVDRYAAELREMSQRDIMPAGMQAEYIGTFNCTAYCCETFPHICGGNGITASGTKPVPGISAAADWDELPAGSVIYIEDVGIRVIEDTGGAINGRALDVLVASHAEAESWQGYGPHRVWLLQGGENQ